MTKQEYDEIVKNMTDEERKEFADKNSKEAIEENKKRLLKELESGVKKINKITVVNYEDIMNEDHPYDEYLDDLIEQPTEEEILEWKRRNFL